MDAEIIRSLHDEFQSFSQEELEEALQQARIEIQDELGKLNQKLCYVMQCFQGLCKPKIDKKQSQKQSRIFKKQRKIQRKIKVFIKNTEKSFLQLY